MCWVSGTSPQPNLQANFSHLFAGVRTGYIEMVVGLSTVISCTKPNLEEHRQRKYGLSPQDQ